MDNSRTDLVDRWPAAAPFVIAGTASVIAGGLIAAVTAHDPTRHGVWTVAYLVLVGGVAQLALGIGQAIFTREPPGQTTTWVEFIGFNAGNAGVIAGTLTGQTWLVDAGSVLLAGALILFLRSVLGVPRTVPVLVYQVLIVFVLGSIPVGMLLART
ncbi:MAG TPA: hypothetical protein VD767_00920 [Thermomicrobiales bacterium]|nr:hypothetical protein [Thermomicrobiales bacterium]